MARKTTPENHLTPYEIEARDAEHPLDRQLTHVHERALADSGIPADYALSEGLYSARTRANLPEPFSTWTHLTSGALVFPKYRFDGSLAFCQIRPDTAPVDAKGRAQKYLQPKGSESAIHVPRSEQPKVGSPEVVELRVIEGTKQVLAAARVAQEMGEEADAILTVGIQGCSAFRNGKGGLHGDLLEILRATPSIRDVVIALDADVATNRQVWNGAEGLRAGLALLGHRARFVDLSKVTGQAKAGLDDVLADYEAKGEDVVSVLDRIFEAAGDLCEAPEKTKRARSSQAVAVDWETCSMGLVSADPEAKGKVEPILDAAIAISEIQYSQAQDGSSSETYTIVAAAKTPAGDVEIEERAGLSTGDLNRVGDWLGSLGDAFAASRIPTSPSLGIMVGNAIRATLSPENRAAEWLDSQARISYELAYTGYSTGALGVSGERCYVDHEKTIAVRNGKVVSVDLVRAADPRRVGLALDVAGIRTVEDARAAVGELAKAARLFRDPTVWAPYVGALAVAYGTDVVAPEVSVTTVGDRSSGKTVLNSAVNGCAYPAQRRSHNGSTLVIEGASLSSADSKIDFLQNCHVVADDMRPSVSRREAETQAQVFQAIVRRSWDSGGRDVKKKARSGEYVSATPPGNHPVSFCVAESIPASLHSSSTLDRTFVVSLETGYRTFSPTDLDRVWPGEHALAAFQRQAADGVYARGIAGLVVCALAGTRTGEAAHADLFARVGETIWTDEARAAAGGISSRAAGLVSRIAAGIWLVHEASGVWPVAIDLPDDDDEALRVIGRSLIARMVKQLQHYAGGGQRSHSDLVVEAIREAVASGAYAIARDDDDVVSWKGRVLGYRPQLSAGSGSDDVVLSPAVTRQMLNAAGVGGRSWSPREVVDAVRPFLAEGEAQRDEPNRAHRIGFANAPVVRGLRLRYSALVGTASSDDAEDTDIRRDERRSRRHSA